MNNDYSTSTLQRELVKKAMRYEFNGTNTQISACVTEINNLRSALQSLIINRPISHFTAKTKETTEDCEWVVSLKYAARLLKDTPEEVML
jgi:hypothetical protein